MLASLIIVFFTIRSGVVFPDFEGGVGGGGGGRAGALLLRHSLHSFVSLYTSLMACCYCRLLVEYSDPLMAGGSLAVVDPSSGSLTDLHTPFTSFGSLSVAQASNKPH